MIITRRASPADLPFIRSSWLRSYWESGKAPKCDYATFHQGYGQIIRRLEPLAIVAAFEAAPDEIAGYVIRGYRVAHWAYVKAPYRRQHIASKLLEGVEEYTTLTTSGKALGAYLKAKYNPWAEE